MIAPTRSLLRPHDDTLSQLLERDSREQFLAAAKELQALQNPSADEIASAAFCLWRARQWKRAAKLASQAVNQEVTAWTVCVHAYSVMGDRDWVKLGDDRDTVGRLLEFATRLPGCPEVAVLRSLTRIGSRGRTSDVEVMERVIREDPTCRETRLRLSERHLGFIPDANAALEALQPLLEERPVTHDAAWMGALALMMCDRPDAALPLLDFVAGTPGDWEAIEALRAGLLENLGRKDEAFTAWGRIVSEGSAAARIMALFARARLHLEAGDASVAVAEIWPVIPNCHAAPAEYRSWSIRSRETGNPLPSLRHQQVSDVAARLTLTENVPSLDDRTIGRLALIALEAGLADAAHAVGLSTDDAADLLTEAADSGAPDPRLHIHLARKYARAQHWGEAVRHGLASAIIAAAHRSAPDFPPSIGISVPWSTLHRDPLLRVHREIVAALKHPLAANALAVFEEIYNAGWHEALLSFSLVAEAAAASESVLGHTRIEAIHAAGLGFDAESDGNLTQAEQWYRLAISLGSDNPGAYYRLAQMLAHQGNLDRAASLEGQAIALADGKGGPQLLEEPLCTFPELLETNRAKATHLADAGQFSEAAKLLLASGRPNRSDRMDAAYFFGQAREWEQADSVLTDLPGVTFDGWVYCYLGYVMLRGREYYALSAEERGQLRALLEYGVTLPGYPEWGIFDLVNLYRYDFSDPLRFHRVRDLLTDAVHMYPDSARIRQSLADELTSGRSPDYAAALEVLTPLLERDSPSVTTLWTAHGCLCKLGRVEEALPILQRITAAGDDPVRENPAALAAEAQLLAEIGRFEPAVATLDRLITHPTPDVRVSAYLLRGALRFRHGQRSLAVADLTDALNLYYLDPNLGLSLGLSVPARMYHDGYGVTEIHTLLESCSDPAYRGELDPRTYGRIQWVRFTYEEYHGTDRVDLAEEALRFAPDARYHRPLSSAYLNVGRFPDALEHYLLWKIQPTVQAKEDDTFGTYYRAELEATNAATRRQMVEGFLKVLRTIEDPQTAEDVFAPVFRGDLWNLLHPVKLWSEILEASSLLSLLLPEDDTIAFYRAYAAHEVGDTQTAETLYRAIIARQPQNASALNNLAVIQEKLGDLDEALTLFRRAAEIQPEAQLYRDNVDRTEKAIANRRVAPPKPAAPAAPAAPANTGKRERIVRAFTVPQRAERLLETLSLQEAVYLLSTIRFAGSEDPRVIVPIASIEGRRLTPTDSFNDEILSDLYDARLLFPRPDSPLDAFTEEGRGLAFYLRQVFWSAGDDSAQTRERTIALESRFREASWPKSWHTQWQSIAERIALEECLAYLVISLEEHGLPFSPGEKTRLTLSGVLAEFAPAQVYNFIWGAVRNAAALTQRTSISRPHAANTVVASIQGRAERALAEGWEVKRYGRDRRAPESVLSQFFYNTVLRVANRGFNERPSALVPPFLPPDL